jgi:hypothetical protein
MTDEGIDRYNQRARRSASLDKGCINMQDLLEGLTKKERKTVETPFPSFKPAHGCTNASDYIVRCFCARLRTGITILKHNRWFWSKSQLGVLRLLPDGKSLTWKPLDSKKDNGKFSKLDLTTCIEVRHALSADPDKRQGNGTAILRRHCTNEMAAKSLSLIFPRCTFDFTTVSDDSFKILSEGFSALCFRFQMERHREEDENVTEESTESNSTTTGPHSPWGL